MICLAWLLFIFSVTIPATFFLYPVLLALFSKRLDLQAEACGTEPYKLPTATLLIIVRNGEKLLPAKIKNNLGLNYPSDRLDILFVSDGSTDDTAKILSTAGPRTSSIVLNEHHGKNHCLNLAVASIRTELIFLTDTDAILDCDALELMARRFCSCNIGGVCGRREVISSGDKLGTAQQIYITFDSHIKVQESISCSISSNDGKLYCVKRDLFPVLPSGVTDDFYVALSVVESGNCFVYEPDARAQIPSPSKDRDHEIIRRRRIVTGSLRAIKMKKHLLNPFKYGLFAIALFINKVLRRLLPLALFGLFASCLFLTPHSQLGVSLLAAQLLFYMLGALHTMVKGQGPALLRKTSYAGYYFILGNWGGLLALWDLLCGRQVSKWDPTK
ncbi:glycosyltransferase [Maridesulfovibrio sp.]|uniref:glycosyltransferase n=1 Tax=Maridesulfovibrio sp. TaxID=2795000 RepID=UPI003BAB292F